MAELTTQYNRLSRTLYRQYSPNAGVGVNQNITNRMQTVTNAYNRYANNTLKAQGINIGNPTRAMIAAPNANQSQRYSRRVYMGLANG